MKCEETVISQSEKSAVDIVGLAPALRELIALDEFAALRETLAIYGEVLRERAM